MLDSSAEVYACEVQGEGSSCTYQSPPESARDELALFPAAAEAKEVGAMVVERKGLSSRVCCQGLRLNAGAGAASGWSRCDRGEPDASLQLGANEWT